MKFGAVTIPGSLFALARDFMAARETFTPADVKAEIRLKGSNELQSVSDIFHNHSVIAHRVAREAIDQMKATGEIVQLKRGTWQRVVIKKD